MSISGTRASASSRISATISGRRARVSLPDRGRGAGDRGEVEGVAGTRVDDGAVAQLSLRVEDAVGEAGDPDCAQFDAGGPERDAANWQVIGRGNFRPSRLSARTATYSGPGSFAGMGTASIGLRSWRVSFRVAGRVVVVHRVFAPDASVVGSEFAQAIHC